MYTFISHLFRTSAGAIKLLSTENGRIKLDTIEEARIYAHTQGIIYYGYQRRGQFIEYYIRLAELMRSENHNRLAAQCYTIALTKVWNKYIEIYESNKTIEDCVDPYDLYKTIRLYLLETENRAGLKKLKAEHDYYRLDFYMCRRRRCSDRDMDVYDKTYNFINEITEHNYHYEWSE